MKQPDEQLALDPLFSVFVVGVGRNTSGAATSSIALRGGSENAQVRTGSAGDRLYCEAITALVEASGLYFMVTACDAADVRPMLETAANLHDEGATVVRFLSGNGTTVAWSYDRDRLIEVGGWRRGDPEWLSDATERMTSAGAKVIEQAVELANAVAIPAPIEPDFEKRRRRPEPVRVTSARPAVFFAVPGIDRVALAEVLRRHYATVRQIDAPAEVAALAGISDDIAIITRLSPDLLNALAWAATPATLIPRPAIRILSQALAVDPSLRDRLDGPTDEVVSELLRHSDRHLVVRQMGGTWLGELGAPAAELLQVALARLTRLEWAGFGPLNRPESVSMLSSGLETGSWIGPPVYEGLALLPEAVAIALDASEPYDQQIYAVAVERLANAGMWRGATHGALVERVRRGNQLAADLAVPNLECRGAGTVFVSHRLRFAREVAGRREDIRDRLTATVRSGTFGEGSAKRFARRVVRRTSPRRTIAMSLLASDGRSDSTEALNALVSEAAFLSEIGHRVVLHVVDNVATEGGLRPLAAILERSNVESRAWFLDRTPGQSVGRNLLIDAALSEGADFIWFNDADTVCVPGFVAAAVDFLERGELLIGCIGAASEQHNESRSGRGMTGAIARLDRRHSRLSEFQVPCHLGLFRSDMFLDGIRFETASPFGRVDSGLESIDCAFQMVTKGYLPMVYDSIVYQIAPPGVSAVRVDQDQRSDRALYNECFEVLCRKWSDVSPIGTRFIEHLTNHRNYEAAQ